MGYTTKFTGEITLSRKLSIAEAKFLLDLAEDACENSQKTTGVNSYLQWVPTETLDAIVWDGNEKFYDYVPLLKWLCGWLASLDITANGRLVWSGESADDAGLLTVVENHVIEQPNKVVEMKSGAPLTMEKLGALAIKLASEVA